MLDSAPSPASSAVDISSLSSASRRGKREKDPSKDPLSTSGISNSIDSNIALLSESTDMEHSALEGSIRNMSLQDAYASLGETSCADLYGPYPSSIPVPFLSKDNDTPPAQVIENAKNMFDLQSTPDYRDKGTPDEWIPRDGRLVRLTGRHPFNVEPPLSVHNKFRFITPSCLHYVRNHGACPNLKWDEHKITIGGPSSLVPSPFEIGMDELAAMEPRELPVTLVCAGNRRKEQNMIRQTIGFNWGASGVSTNVWKGVMLRDLLLRAGVSEKNMAGKHVEFIGVEDLPNKVGPGPFKDEPWGKLGK